jgi:hypothetical protein
MAFNSQRAEAARTGGETEKRTSVKDSRHLVCFENSNLAQVLEMIPAGKRAEAERLLERGSVTLSVKTQDRDGKPITFRPKGGDVDVTQVAFKGWQVYDRHPDESGAKTILREAEIFNRDRNSGYIGAFPLGMFQNICFDYRCAIGEDDEAGATESIPDGAAAAKKAGEKNVTPV